LAHVRIRTLVQQLKMWALEKRKPWFHLLLETSKDFLPASLVGIPMYRRPAFWLQKSFTKRYWRALTGYEPRLRVFGALPSFQDNVSTLDVLRRQLGCISPVSDPAYEKRYPYLDRSLLEFLFAVPRAQLLRPGQRRSLMRRALRGLVPEKVLNRRRKAFITKGPLEAISSESAKLVEMSRQMLTASLGIVDPEIFSEVPIRAAQGQEIPIVSYLRTVYTEFWLRDLNRRGILSVTEHLATQPRCSLRTDISRETNYRERRQQYAVHKATDR
jgi:asparagine synthase (glutamine-hydrolysing)